MEEKLQAQIITACQRGDPHAYEQLIRCYQTQVYSLAMRMLGNPEDAADVTQETFIRVFRTIDKFRGDASFSTWIYRVTSNLCLDWLRRRKRRALSSDAPVSWEHETAPRELADTSPNPEDLVAAAELRQEIQSALNQLESYHRLAVILRDVQGLSYEEVAGILNLPLGTVKSRINRGRRQLRKILQGKNIL